MRSPLLHFSGLLAAVVLMAGTVHAEPAKPAAAGSEVSERVLRREIAQGIYEIAYSANQKALFVASAGGRGEDAEASRILRLNPETLEVQSEHALPGRGFGLTLDDAAGRLYVGDTMGAAVTILDTATGAVIATVPLAEKTVGEDGKEGFPHHFRQLRLDPAKNRLYMPGFSTKDSALYVIDTAALKVEKVIPGLGFVATGIVVDSDKSRVDVSNLQGDIHSIDTETLEIAATYATNGDQLLNLELDRATRRLFATDQGHEMIVGMLAKTLPDYKVKGTGNQVVVLNADDGSAISQIPTGEGPIALLLDQERSRLYVTNRAAGSVTVFDTASSALIDTIALPSHPNSLTLDRAGNVLFVTIKNGKDDPKGAQESIARIQF